MNTKPSERAMKCAEEYLRSIFSDEDSAEFRDEMKVLSEIIDRHFDPILDALEEIKAGAIPCKRDWLITRYAMNKVERVTMPTTKGQNERE
jgi:hypothetical protein